jgi:Protein of unknown function (DUF983)
MSFFSEGPLYSVVRSKCPRCNLGNLYEDNHPYHIRKLGQMKKSCPSCDQKYEPEVGFYYGAMYVSYGFTILVTFIPAGILYFFFHASNTVLVSTVIGINLLLWPISFRWSRNIWLNTFVKYEPKWKEKLAKCPEKAVY